MKSGTSLPSPSRKQTISQRSIDGLDAGGAGAAIAALRLAHDAGAGFGGKFSGAVGRAVVDDDDLVDLLRQHVADDVGDRLFFVEARDDDADEAIA